MSGGGDAGSDAEDAAKVQAKSQQQALDYLKQTERLPQAYREGSLGQLGTDYGFMLDANGNPVQDGSTISQRAMSSPFYTNAVKVGEDSVLRNASATGGLRSGNIQEALAQTNQNAYLASYQNQLSGLQGFANLPSNANNIAAQQSSIGQTLAQGMLGSAQSSAAQSQNNVNNAIGAGTLALQGYQTFSDERLKANVRYVGDLNGHRVYTWTWNDKAKSLGLSGSSSGVIAQEVEKIAPHAVSERDGFKCVDYAAIGVTGHGI